MIWNFLIYSRLLPHSVPLMFPVILLKLFLSKLVIDRKSAQKLILFLALFIYAMILSAYHIFNGELNGINWRQYISFLIGFVIAIYLCSNLFVLKRNVNLYVFSFLVISISYYLLSSEIRYRAFTTETAAAGQIILYILIPLVYVSQNSNLRNVNIFLCALGLLLTYSGTVYLQVIIALVLYIFRRRLSLIVLFIPLFLYAYVNLVIRFFPETYMSSIISNIGNFISASDSVILSMTVFDKLGSFLLPALFVFREASIFGYGLGSEEFLINSLFLGYEPYLHEVLSAKTRYGLVSLHGKILLTFGFLGYILLIGWAFRLFTLAVKQRRRGDQNYAMLSFVLPTSFYVGSFFAFGTLAFPVLWFVFFAYPILLRKVGGDS